LESTTWWRSEALSQRTAKRPGLMVCALRGGMMDTAQASTLVRLAAETRLPQGTHIAAIFRELFASTPATCASFERVDDEPLAFECVGLSDELRTEVLVEHAQYARAAIAGKTLLAGEMTIPGRHVLCVPVDTQAGWRALVLSAKVDFDEGSVAFARVAADVLANVLERESIDGSDLIYRDALTLLPNRDATFSRIGDALYSAARHATRVAVLYVDIDRFKSINDEHGHAVGDLVLIEVSKRMLGSLRHDELFGRLGGDEFAAVLPKVSGVDEALSAAERLSKRLAEPMEIDGVALRVSGSIGIALYPEDGDSAELLLEHADAAMYQAKREGRGSIRLFGENVATELRTRRDLRDSLRGADIERDFLLCFQPAVHAASGRVVAAEALLRWIHPSRGLLAPRAFYAMAETMRLSTLLDCWVVGSALRSLQGWVELGFDPIVNVNVSAPDAAIVAELRRLGREEGLDTTRLRIEMSENTALTNIDATKSFFLELRRLGVRTGLDAFGANNTSLRMLATVPIDFIKLDRSITAHVVDDEGSARLATVAMSLASSFGMVVAADAVETAEQARWLAERGIVEIQGYGIAQPMIAPDFAHWWTQRGEKAHVDGTVVPITR
jgi:diguanylate cyclase (GGDEF)-like protein